MAQQTRATLESFFETGDAPTALQFRDFIQSVLNFLDDNVHVAVDGKVGIGTTTPAALLEVVGNTPGNVGGFPSGAFQLRGLGTGEFANAVITLHNSFNGNTQLLYIGSSASGNNNMLILGRQQALLQLGTGGLTTFTITPQGNIGIDTTVPAAKFHVVGRVKIDGQTGIGNFPLEMGSGAHVTVGGVWTDASSREYKKNIMALNEEAALRDLEELSPVSFEYKNSGEKHLGFIAEDVPESVATPDRQGLGSQGLIALLVKVVQSQQQGFQSQQQGFQSQQQRIAQLEKRLDAVGV